MCATIAAMAVQTTRTQIATAIAAEISAIVSSNCSSSDTRDASEAVAREQTFTRLRTLLAVHETAEERIVHPRGAPQDRWR